MAARKAPAATTTTPRKRATTKPAAKPVQPPAPPSYLMNLIPEAEVGDAYVSRFIDGVADLDAMANAQRRGDNILIEGDTGSGKTMLIRAYAAKTGQPFVNMAGDGSAEPADYFGGPTVDVTTGGLRWLDGPTLMVVQEGGVLNVDEVNFFKAKVTAPLHGLLDGRGVLTLNKHPFKWMSSESGKYYITQEDATDAGDVADIPVTGAAYVRRHPNLLVVATYNDEYEDTNPLNEAFANRFAVKWQWGYDPDVEACIIISKKLRDMAANLRQSRVNGVITTPISTNMLMAFERMACDDDLTFSYAASCFINNFKKGERPTVKGVLDLFRSDLMAEWGWEDLS